MIKIEAPERLKILKKGARYQMQRSFRLILGIGNHVYTERRLLSSHQESIIPV